MQELKKICEISEKLFFGIEEKQAVLKNKNTILIIRLMEGDFPDYKNLLDVIDMEKSIEVDRQVLNQAFRRINLITEDKFNNVQFVLTTDKITLSSHSIDIGNARETIITKYSGEDLNLGFNGKYFIDTLSVMTSDKIKIYISSNEKPCLIFSENEPEFMSVVMPMKL